MFGLFHEQGGSPGETDEEKNSEKRSLSSLNHPADKEAPSKDKLTSLVRIDTFFAAGRILCVLTSMLALLVQIPYYPIGIALLFSLILAAVSYKYPRLALAVGVALSIPSMVYQGGGAWVVYALLSLLLVATILDHWLTGFLTLSSILLAFSPLSVLSPIPLFLAGLLLEPQSGAKTGLTASLFIAFLALCWDRNTAGFFYVGSESLNAFYDASPRPLLELNPRIEDFRPLSIYDAFDKMCFSRLGSCGREMVDALSGLGRSYSVEIALWAETAIWMASGYLAGKTVPWFRRLRLLPNPMMPAAFASSVLFLVGTWFYGQTDLIRSAFLIIVVLCISIFIGDIRFEFELGRLRSTMVDARSELEIAGTSLDKAHREGVNVSAHRGMLEGFNHRLNGAALMLQEGRMEDAGRELQDLQSQIRDLQGRLEEDLEEVRSVGSSLEDAEAKVEDADELIRRIEEMYADPSLPRFRGELVRIRSEVEEVRGLLETGDNKGAYRKARELSSRGRTLKDELDLRVRLWQDWLPQHSAIKSLLEKQGKVSADSLVDMPVQLRRDVLRRYWEENRDATAIEGDALLVRTAETIYEQITCKACGAQIPGDSVYCIGCGKRVIEAMKTFEEEKVLIKEKRKPQVEAVTYDQDLMVLNYVVEHRGTISLSKAAKSLGITVKELEESLERLKRSGKIA